MTRKKQPLLLTQVQENNQTYYYLGSDGLAIEDSHNQYLQRCSEFMARAKKYKKDNLNMKNSILHQVKKGYENTDSLEEEILNERQKCLEDYNKAFDVTRFHDDSNKMYENNKALSKRIRIIRQLEDERVSKDFTDNFDKESMKWFTRYCTLSKFIQVARMVIILNRMTKRLKILRALTPEDVKKYEIDVPEEPLNEFPQPVKLPCDYCPNDGKQNLH